jgi:beta-glucosidase
MELTQSQKIKVEELLAQMTLDEKIGQMNLESVSIVGGFDVPFEELIEMMTDGRISQEEFGKIMSTAEQDYHEEDIRAGRVGALMLQDPEKVNELQKIAVEESRLPQTLCGLWRLRVRKGLQYCPDVHVHAAQYVSAAV